MTYPCKECGKMVRIRSKGLCPLCRSKSKPKNKRLDVFFREQIEKLKVSPYSVEDGDTIYKPSRKNICHILPKRHFKSVESNELNIVYLTWQQHSDFDRLIDTGDFEGLQEKFPNTCLLIENRLPLLLDEVTESHKMLEFFKRFLDTI